MHKPIKILWKSPKLLSQRIRNSYYKTFGTSVINSPLSLPSLINLIVLVPLHPYADLYYTYNKLSCGRCLTTAGNMITAQNSESIDAGAILDCVCLTIVSHVAVLTNSEQKGSITFLKRRNTKIQNDHAYCILVSLIKLKAISHKLH